MTDDFKSEDLVRAYRMMGGGVTKMIATKGGREGLYDLTPIDWCMPMDYEPVTKVIFSCAPEHQCDANIRRSREFAVCVPADPSDPIIEKCGSVSSADIDKFTRFGITGTPADKTDLRIPVENCRGWIECRLDKVLREGSVDLFIGVAVAAFLKK